MAPQQIKTLKTVFVDGKYYRQGYTTGTTATAAAYAAACLAVNRPVGESLMVQLPEGTYLEVPVHSATCAAGMGRASVIKDGGDDIDVTNGIEIFAEVQLTEEPKILLRGGEGVGVVTKGGLQVPVGEPAINPVPRQMIEAHVRRVIGPSQGAIVTLWIPEGQKAAEKTFNPRLGIVGGISIIGTTGIVEPMSEEAWKHSLEAELDQYVSETGRATEAHTLNQALVFVPGSHGEKYAVQHFGVAPKDILTMSNFVGFMLMAATKRQVKRVFLVGHIGKLIKVAGGIFHTHSRVADGRNDIMTAYAALRGAERPLLDQLFRANTTDEAVDLLLAHALEDVLQDLALAVKEKAETHTYGALEVHVALYDMKGRLLGLSIDEAHLQAWLRGE